MNRGAALLLCMMLAACGGEPAGGPGAGGAPPLTLGAVLVPGDTTGFATATLPGAIRLPRDHGEHPEFRTEWWYLTGNLEDREGRRYGYQFTLFRLASAPERTSHPSAWHTNQLYLAHATLADIDGERFLQEQRAARGALGLAGVTAAPLAAWVDDWRLEGDPACADCARFRVRVRAKGFAYDLELTSARPPVLHGDQGLSYKDREGNNASYYYSLTRLQSTGELVVDGQPVAVTGASWFDHEWSTSTLTREQSGWDWFALQLADGSELMLFQVRSREDAARHFIDGTFVARDGSRRALGGSEIRIGVTAWWRSPRSDVEYPAGWRLVIPAIAADLAVAPLMANQEVDLALRYWEGAVSVSGELGGKPVGGRGYAELTGYGSALPGPVDP